MVSYYKLNQFIWSWFKKKLKLCLNCWKIAWAQYVQIKLKCQGQGILQKDMLNACMDLNNIYVMQKSSVSSKCLIKA